MREHGAGRAEVRGQKPECRIRKSKTPGKRPSVGGEAMVGGRERPENLPTVAGGDWTSESGRREGEAAYGIRRTAHGMRRKGGNAEDGGGEGGFRRQETGIRGRRTEFRFQRSENEVVMESGVAPARPCGS